MAPKVSSAAERKINLGKNKDRIPSLDGLRGLAILLVLFFHLFFYLPGSSYGWAGVDLFFVLSGFLITGILMDAIGQAGYWKNFYVRRILRIFPLYYLTLILILITAWLLRPYYEENQLHFNMLWQNQEWLWFYIFNWWEYLNERSFPAQYVSHYWTLAVEEQFYLVWPFVIYLFRGKKLLVVIAIILLSAVLIRYILFYFGDGSSYPEVYVATFTRMDSIAAGALIAYAVRNERLLKLLNDNRDLIFFLSLAIILYTGFSDSFRSGAEGFIKFGYTANAMMFGALLLYAISPDHWVTRALNNQFLKFFGKYSYAMYIFHWPLVNFLFYNLQVKMGFLDYTLVSKLISSAIILILTILLSLVSWYLWERRFLLLKKHFSLR
ncbi:MAG: acyltransferase family protein [Cyclobacteriaceae bacterium]